MYLDAKTSSSISAVEHSELYVDGQRWTWANEAMSCHLAPCFSVAEIGVILLKTKVFEEFLSTIGLVLWRSRLPPSTLKSDRSG